MTTKKDALNWFEIFVNDFDRAKRFYETILKTSLTDCAMEDMKMSMFPSQCPNGVGGAITQMPGVTGGAGGTLVYLNVEGDLDGVISRIPKAGGAITKPRTSIGEHGFIAIFKDTEGNVVGLHSIK